MLQRKNFENQSIFGDVMDKSLVSCFLTRGVFQASTTLLEINNLSPMFEFHIHCKSSFISGFEIHARIYYVYLRSSTKCVLCVCVCVCVCFMTSHHSVFSYWIARFTDHALVTHTRLQKDPIRQLTCSPGDMAVCSICAVPNLLTNVLHSMWLCDLDLWPFGLKNWSMSLQVTGRHLFCCK